MTSPSNKYNKSNNISRSTADESDNWRRKPNVEQVDQPTNSFQRRSFQVSNSKRNNYNNHRQTYNNNQQGRDNNNNEYNGYMFYGYSHGYPLTPAAASTTEETTYYQTTSPIIAQSSNNETFGNGYEQPYYAASSDFTLPPPTSKKITVKPDPNDKKKKRKEENSIPTTEEENTTVTKTSPGKWQRYSKDHKIPSPPPLSSSSASVDKKENGNALSSATNGAKQEEETPTANGSDKKKRSAQRKGKGRLNDEEREIQMIVEKRKRTLTTAKTTEKGNGNEEEPATTTTVRTAADQQENWRSTAASLPPPPPKEFNNKPKPYQHPDDRNSSNRRELFLPFLSPFEIEEKVQQGELYQGIIRFSKNRQDAYVTADNLDSDIYIGGFRDRNRALHGDFVAVKLLDVDTVWNLRKEREAKRFKDRQEKRDDLKRKQLEEERAQNGQAEEDLVDGDIEEVEEMVIEEEKETVEEDDEDEAPKPEFCGDVVGILDRPADATYSGTIVTSRFADDQKTNIAPGENNKPKENPPRIAWFKPTDKKIPFLVLRNNDIPIDLIDNEEYYKCHLFSAGIRRWQICDIFPSGRIIKEIGPMGDLMSEREAILANNNIIIKEFGPTALAALPILPWSIPETELKKRRDLRNERIFSIDPITAKDLDDALHIKELEDGFFEVGVHIADVSYFLKKGSALDNEAKERGTSTYLVDSVIPMLPAVLCEELCSLNPGVDRLAFSVIWKLDGYGKPVDTWYGKTVIRSCAKLSYESAQAVIEGDEIPKDIIIHDDHSLPDVSKDIFLLYTLSSKMREKRYTSGSLSLQSVKLYFQLDDQGEPISVAKCQTKEANHLVEEFMLLANISVAKKIASAFPEEALLRKHEEPLPRRLDEFIKLTDSLGLDFNGFCAGDLQASFDQIQNKDVKDVLLVLAIRCMQRAKYICSGTQDITKYRHYALDEALYTHFTSPIRRYADVVIHRLLEAALKKKNSCGYTKKVMNRLSFHCNNKKDGAKAAQDNNIQMYLARYLSNQESLHGPIYTKADVMKVMKGQYEIYVPEYGLEKKFHVEDLPTENHYFDKLDNSLDIFWKRGVPVTMHNEEKIYAQERIRNDDYSDSSSSSVEEKEEGEKSSLENSMNAMALNAEPERRKITSDQELIPPVVLEPKTCLQRLKMFSTIGVRIQINMDRSPPIINVYPINPFSGEEVKKNSEEA